MNKRILHAMNTILTKPQTVEGLGEVELHGTVNEPAHLLDVHGRSEQVVQEQGKNLADLTKFAANNNSDLKIENNSITANTDFFIYVTFKAKAGEVYYAKATVYDVQSDKTLVKNLIPYYWHGYATKGNVPEDVIKTDGYTLYILQDVECDLLVYNVKTGENRETVFSEIMISKEDILYEPFQPAMPSPEYPSEIYSTGGKLESHGWNLFDKETMVISNTTLKGDVFTRLPQTYDSIIANKYWIPEPSQDYTVFIDVLSDIQSYELSIKSDDRFYFDKQITYLKKGKNYVHVRTRDSFENVTIGSLWLAGPKIDREIKFKLQILKGHVNDVPYDRYRASSISLPELRCITDTNGNVVAEDILYIDREQKRAWVERQVESIILTGEEKYENAWYPNITCNIKKYANYNAKMICNYGTEARNGNITGTNICFSKSDAYWHWASADEAKAWIKERYENGNPVVVQYALLTPEIEELPYEPLQMSQYYTKITAESEVQPMIKIIANSLKIRGGYLLSRIIAAVPSKLVLTKQSTRTKIDARRWCYA